VISLLYEASQRIHIEAGEAAGEDIHCYVCLHVIPHPYQPASPFWSQVVPRGVRPTIALSSTQQSGQMFCEELESIW